MGIELPSDEDFVRSELARIKKQYGKKRGNISFQFGFINEIISFENCGMRESEFVGDIKQMRLNIREKITKEYGLQLSFRENMPQSNIIYFIDKSDEALMEEMNSGAKQKVKHGFSKNVDFQIATPDQYEEFYQKRSKVAGFKGFAPITKQQFYQLMEYLEQKQCGHIFITLYQGQIIAGSICLLDDNHLIYLYGFAERGKNSYGGQQYLKFKAFGRAREHGYDYCDMMGGAPTGFDDHPLTGVSKFKESLGGSKIELYGSFDLVLHKGRYTLFNWYTHLRTKS
jgi:lipid II:glycine glycyltransferase (peptidoglycan interpeptide bridge formation enzyme)